MNISLAGALLAASLLAFTDMPEQMRKIFDESVLTGQQIATAGDLRSLATMLDVHYVRHGHYPATERFPAWLAATFRENHLKDLATDHWGHPLQYATGPARKSYLLRSVGPDGEAGTADDMTVSGP